MKYVVKTTKMPAGPWPVEYCTLADAERDAQKFSNDLDCDAYVAEVVVVFRRKTVRECITGPTGAQ